MHSACWLEDVKPGAFFVRSKARATCIKECIRTSASGARKNCQVRGSARATFALV